ncbi:hypothetical protein GGF40_001040 [Coemansia sp. RSA 1286]|nr:hypothetical protein GGF39_003472 [Coemansia sp. RSA 1721]KAJ2639180.1 hypothetical protein GGF40_001040 [Coemansia sp. RSA 1286]
MFSKNYIKSETDLGKLKRLEPMYNGCKANWRTKAEMDMIKASIKVRSKPKWGSGLEDKTVREQWIGEMKSNSGLTDKQAAYVIAELFYYAKLQAAARCCGGDAKLSVVDMVWYTDIPEDSDMAQEFNASLSKMLEAMPKAHYYRPVSDEDNRIPEQIVDPSLYSLVYDSTPILAKPMTSPQEALCLPSFGTVPGSIDGWKKAVCDLNASMAEKDNGKGSEQSKTPAASFVPFNEKYLGLVESDSRHWLPTDIYVNQDGSVDFKSYINNIHPEKHANMYMSISKIISKAIPLLEQVLTDWEHTGNLRIPYNFMDCISIPTAHPLPPGETYTFGYDEYADLQYRQAVETWYDSIVSTVPDPEGFVEPKRPLVPYSLRNKNIQVVVEITDKDTPPLVSTASENIIATAVYYYEINSEEKTPKIEFHEAINSCGDPIGCFDDLLIVNIVFGVNTHGHSERAYTQSAGSINVKQGRLVCYPNVYKLCMDDYSANLKKLAMYFVDPSVRIVSTSIVPPQQKDWWTKTVSSVPSRISKLPMELQNMVFKHVDSPMSFERACEVSKERTGAVYVKRTSEYYNNQLQKFVLRVRTGTLSIYSPYW